LYAFSSVSDDEAVVATGLAVLVADEAVATLGKGLSLHVQNGAQVLEQTHLVAVVLGVVLDVALVLAQLLDQDLLLSQLGVEELLVGFEFGGEALVWIREVLGLVAQTLLERLVNIGLDIILVELAFGFFVLGYVVADVLVQAVLFSVQVALHAVVLAFLLVVLDLDVAELVSQSS